MLHNVFFSHWYWSTPTYVITAPKAKELMATEMRHPQRYSLTQIETDAGAACEAYATLPTRNINSSNFAMPAGRVGTHTTTMAAPSRQGLYRRSGGPGWLHEYGLVISISSRMLSPRFLSGARRCSSESDGNMSEIKHMLLPACRSPCPKRSRPRKPYHRGVSTNQFRKLFFLKDNYATGNQESVENPSTGLHSYKGDFMNVSRGKGCRTLCWISLMTDRRRLDEPCFGAGEVEALELPTPSKVVNLSSL